MNTAALARKSYDFSFPRIDGWTAAIITIVVVFSVAILIPPAIVLWLSLRELNPIEDNSAYSFLHYVEVFSDPFVLTVMANTIGFSLSSLLVALVFGVPVAWLVERTDLKAKPLVYTLMTLGLLMPGFAVAMGWLFLLHPRIGIINKMAMDLLDLPSAPFNIASVAGMGWVQGLSLAPLAFIMTAAVLRAIDPSLEESAHMSGAGVAGVMRKVTLPLAWPGILAAGIYIFTIGFAAFDVPAIIGWSNKIFTFSTFLLLQLGRDEGLPRYGAVAALSMVVIAIAGLLIWWYGRLQRHAHRYQVVTGKGYRPRMVQLRGYSWAAWAFLAFYFILSKLLPLLVLIWASLLQYFRYPSLAAFKSVSLRQFENAPWELVIEGLKNTALLMVMAPTVTVAVAVLFSWVVLRSKIPGRQSFDFIAFLPHAVPSIVFGFAMLLFTLFVVRNAIPLHGTIWVLLMVFVIARLSYATRMTNSTLIQIHKDLEEAATMSGGSTGPVVRRVIMPLLAPTLLYAWLWVALLTFRELTLAVILSTRDNLTLPVVVWNAWVAGGFGQAAAITLVLMALMVPLVALYWWGVRKTGLRASA